jgi:prepilin-type N-terminal cleavage/methylation domain-containing protein
MFHRKKNPQRGFTLVELLIVVAIIGILATIVIVNVVAVKIRARDAQRKSDLAQLQSAFEFYRADLGTYPPALPACGSALTGGSSVYLSSVPCDPLNTGQYKFSYTSTGATYTLTACLENINDSQKDAANNNAYCTGGSTNWSYTKTNP